MRQQDEHAKMEKFIETMPTIIQTHLIIEPNWDEITIAPLIAQGAGAVPGLYSHIAQFQDQDLASLPKPFKKHKR